MRRLLVLLMALSASRAAFAQYDMGALMNFANQMNQVNQMALQSIRQENEELEELDLTPYLEDLSPYGQARNQEIREHNKAVMRKRARKGDEEAREWLQREAEKERFAARNNQQAQGWQAAHDAKVRRGNREAARAIEEANGRTRSSQAISQDEIDLRNATTPAQQQRALENLRRDQAEYDDP